MTQPPYLLLYDENCPLCTNLAIWVQRRSQGNILVRGALEYHQEQNKKMELPLKLQIIKDDKVYYDDEAWRLLLDINPGLKSLAWLAQRLGFEASAGKILAWVGHAARRLCAFCPR